MSIIVFDMIDEAIKLGASDIHFAKNYPPALRVHGNLIYKDEHGKMTTDMLAIQTDALLTNDKLKDMYKANKYVDSSIEHGGWRLRVHIYRDRESDAIALRLIPNKIPTISELYLPDIVRTFTLTKNGIVLVTGTTGSGKSTTLAAIINEINLNQYQHIITVEDPVEFVYSPSLSLINQREVGMDVHSFPDAVKGAMREDPDILLVGEMRDLETIENAITMAETGHLVFATLHTKSAPESFDRMIDVFPANQQEQIRVQLSNTIQGVISQTLVQKSGGGRVPVCEILIANDAIRNLIKERATTASILDQMQMNSKKLGSQTFNQSLARLYRKNLITMDTALTATSSEEDLKKMIAME